MTTSLPFTLALPSTHEIRLRLRHFLLHDPRTGRIIGHVYSTPLIYPMDAKFFAMGYGRVRQHLKDNRIPDRVSLTRDVTHILKNKDGSISLSGNDCLSIQITGEALGYLDECFLQDIFARFYDNASLLISLR